MSLLRDAELVSKIKVIAPIIPYVEGVELPEDPYSKDSPVQASSVDLHIGNIYIPGAKERSTGGAQKPKSDHVLQTGETAVVTTKETLHLPGTVAGFGFPPSRVSFRGLLMTNPGHVDPGYEGVMRFAVINMAREPYSLRRGDRIATLLLFDLEHAVHSDWRRRNPGGEVKGPSPISQANIDRLSKDFVDVEKRARKIATEKGVQWTLIVTSVVAILVALFQALGGGHLFYGSDIEALEKRQDIVEYDVKNRVNLEQKLEEIDIRLKELERAKSDVIAQLKKKEGLGKPSVPGAPGKQP